MSLPGPVQVWLQVEEVTWGYKHPLVDMANLILPEDQKLPELYGYFSGEELDIES